MTDTAPQTETPQQATPPVTPPSPPAQAPRPPLVSGARIAALIPSTIDEAYRLAQGFVRAGMVPKGYTAKGENPSAEEMTARVMLSIMTGMEIGLPPMAAVKNIVPINNRPTLWGDGVVAVLQASGQLEWEKVEWSGTKYADDWTCTYTAKRRGMETPYSASFSVADAKKAGLWSRDTYQGYGQRMLQAKARNWVAKDGFSDLLQGVYIREEVEEVAAKETAALPNTSSLDVGLPTPPLQVESQTIDQPVPAIKTEAETVPVGGDSENVADHALEASKPQETKKAEKPPTSECQTCGGGGEVPRQHEETGEDVWDTCPDCVPDKPVQGKLV